jgi:HEAT repeat protein
MAVMWSRAERKTILICSILLMVCVLNGCSSKNDKNKPDANSVQKAPNIENAKDVVKNETVNQGEVNSETRRLLQGQTSFEKTANPAQSSTASAKPLPKKDGVYANSRSERKKAFANEIVKLFKSQRQDPNRPQNVEQTSSEDKWEADDEALKELDSIGSSVEKINFISEFSAAHPESTAELVDRAMKESDPEVRRAAMEALAGYESPDVLDAISRAMDDQDEQTREVAVSGLASIEDKRVNKLLIKALSDNSENVRASALEVVEQQGRNVSVDVLKAGIASVHTEVKERTVTILTDLSTHNAVDVLILGLKDTDPELHREINFATEFLISKEFESYEEAEKWWRENRNKFDQNLSEKN